MTTSIPLEARVLQLSLHGRRVGYLAGFTNGQNVLTFERVFREDPTRLTFSLTTHPEFPRADRLDDGVRIITVQEVKKRDERTY